MNVPRSVGQGRLWEESLPGITCAIAYVRDPGSAAQDCLPRGASNPTVVVRWQTAESRWTHVLSSERRRLAATDHC